MQVSMSYKIARPRAEYVRELIWQEFRKTLRKVAAAAIKAAAAKIHVETGMSLASVYPAAREFRILGKIRRPPVRDQVKGYTDIEGNYDKDFIKTATAGEILAEDYPAFTYAEGNRRKPFLNMTYTIVIGQFGMWDADWGFSEKLREMLLMGARGIKHTAAERLAKKIKREIVGSVE